MNLKEQLEHMRKLAAADGRYRAEAFVFVSEAIAYTVEAIRHGKIPPAPGGSRGEGDMFHVSGRELLEGIRLLAKERWGELAPLVLRHWGVRRTEDFGEIVFCMVEDPDMAWSKRDCDTRDDFRDGFDFDTAFGMDG
ncbi:MAG: hypothetical protein J6333_02395 [Planctomycetes bacterium]|nr:hypothetical protein [Planctomycetota bacterium]